MQLTFSRADALRGTLRVPSDKSLTHRAIMFASIASGRCDIFEPSRGHDPLSTLECVRALGAEAHWEDTNHLVMTPPEEWRQPAHELDCGNSGTTMRLISGLLASRDLTATLIGDESLSRRPMGRIAEPLRLMGAEIEGSHAPVTIKGAGKLSAIDYESPVASAQIKSAVLLAGLRASGPTSVLEPALSRDHTERMLRALGVQVSSEGLPGGSHRATVWPRHHLDPFRFTVPADISSAAFPMVAAALVPGSDVVLKSVGVNPTRTGILDVFSEIGIAVDELGGEDDLGEPVSDLHVRHSHFERPFEIGGPLIPRLIDEIPVLSVLATQLPGRSVIRDAKELRIKETDRIEKMASGLREMGAVVEVFEDGMAIDGPCKLRGITIESGGDHRIGMAFAIAGLIADGETVIKGADTIGTSFPGFQELLRSLVS